MIESGRSRSKSSSCATGLKTKSKWWHQRLSCAILVLTISTRVDEDDIEDQCTALRKKLEAQQSSSSGPNAKGLKTHQVHELAEAKIRESERFRSALGISKNYEEGSHWKRQEEKMKAGSGEKD